MEADKVCTLEAARGYLQTRPDRVVSPKFNLRAETLAPPIQQPKRARSTSIGHGYGKGEAQRQSVASNNLPYFSTGGHGFHFALGSTNMQRVSSAIGQHLG
jgi:hypothetical protein